MSETDHPFAERLARISRRRRQQARGPTHVMGPDGLVLLRRRPRRRLPLRGLALLLCGGLLFKTVLFVHLGESGYALRLEALAAGTAVERAGAVVMQADPATRAIAGAWRRLAP